jgi:hypothetical protein
MPICGTPPIGPGGFPDPQAGAGIQTVALPGARAPSESSDLDAPPSGIRADMSPIHDPAEVERERRADARRAEVHRKA